MRKTLLCVSFGTRVETARRHITLVENALREAAPDYAFVRAFTSPTIRRILQARGETVPSLEQALAELPGGQVIVQPTHLLYGIEYDRIKQTVANWTGKLFSVALGKPLLAGTDDLQHLARALSRAYPPAEGEALVLMGHGTPHFAGVVYPALQSVFRMLGRPDIHVAAVEGWPALEDILPMLDGAAVKTVRLLPLMLVAGDHAWNDMAGDAPESWKSRLNAAGFDTRCTLQGLGELPEVRAMYCRHLRELLA